MLRNGIVWSLGALLFCTSVYGQNSDEVDSKDTGGRYSFADFREYQSDYCDLLVRALNTPVHWHVVIDNSRSFGFPQEPERRKQVETVIHMLPLEAGDKLTLDTFNGDYQAGRVKYGPIQDFQLTHAGRFRSLTESELRPLLEEAAAHDVQERTDFLRLVERLHELPCEKDFRLYFVVLTDGWNEPSGPGPHQPLFSFGGSANTPFFTALDSFGASSAYLERGLTFLLDTSRVDAGKKKSVDADWDLGMRLLNDERSTHGNPTDRPWERHFLPVITRLNPDDEESSLDDSIAQSLDRKDGIFACLTTATSRPGKFMPGSWPTPTGYREPPFRFLEGLQKGGNLSAKKYDNDPPVTLYEIHTLDAFLTDRADLSLPLRFVTRGNASRTLQVSLYPIRKDTTPRSFSEPNWELHSSSTKNGTGDRWQPLSKVFILPLTEVDREQHDLPWCIQVGFADDEAPFLTLNVTPDGQEKGWCGFVHTVATRMWRYLRLQGRWEALAAPILIFFSLFLSIPTLSRMKVEFWYKGPGDNTFQPVEIEPIPGEDQSASKRDFLHWNDMHLARQVRLRVTEKMARLVLRRSGPSIPHTISSDGVLVPSEQVDVDFVSFLGALYHVAYYVDLKERPLIRDKWKRLLLFGKTIGVVILPRRIWVPSFADAGERRPAFKKFFLGPKRYWWGETISVPIFRDNWDIDTIVEHCTRVGVGDVGRYYFLRFWMRSMAVLFCHIAFALAIFAIWGSVDAFGGVHWVPVLGVVVAALALGRRMARYLSFMDLGGSLGRAMHSKKEGARRQAIGRVWNFDGAALMVALVISVISVFLSTDTVGRLLAVVLTVLVSVVGVWYFHVMRDWIFCRRLEDRRPIGPLDVVLEFLFRRSPI